MDDLGFELDDSVLFELPALRHVKAFSERFRPRWDLDGRIYVLEAVREADLAARSK